LDPNVEETRKSAPLYHDLGSTRSTAVRAKYINEKVDAKTVSMAMIKDGSKASVQKLAEFNLCRQAIVRGGEHVFLRWSEATWDDFFRAPDFDWSTIKQKETKCILLFCDRLLYCLCPIFGLAAFMLMGGLRRDNTKWNSAIKDYVFPMLHSMKKEGMVNTLTRNIKKFITLEHNAEIAKKYGTRSLHKATMTEDRVNRHLLTQKEYHAVGTPPRIKMQMQSRDTLKRLRQ
jgi:hypothetical protein